ncbi:MAG: esterase family protein [Planctomycetes bacterium]|nr:esterase family protein [Planctomycetota bacterium]MBL7142835.1 esterase family protein [Phycisphaerae bacterium]
MKKFTIILIMLLPTLTFAQTGKVFDNLSMKSEILNMDRKYAIYLPPDYETSKRSYPVLYLLHGGGDDQTGWVQFGEVKYIADKTIKKGKSTPMIIVMPDANSGKRGFTNDAAGQWRYEDFFFEEFMPFIETTYRIKSEKRYRAIAGLSMGGGGTYYYALHRPDLFQAACPLSASARPINKEGAQSYMKRRGMTDASEEQVEDWMKKYNIHEMIKNMPEDKKKSVRWYIDCGDDDFLYEGNSLVHIAMRKNDIPHEFRIRDGKHDWTYWRHSLYDVLNFISIGFHQGID